jgi:hypothetical protein
VEKSSRAFKVLHHVKMLAMMFVAILTITLIRSNPNEINQYIILALVTAGLIAEEISYRLR